MPDQAARGRQHMTVSVLGLGIFAYGLLQALVVPVLSTIRTEFHTSQSTVTWVLTAYLLSASISTPILGRIGDALGKKSLLLVSLGGLVVGCALAALATNIEMLIFARVVQGIGGGVLPLSFGVVRDLLPRKRVSGAIGTLAALASVGGGVGLVLAGPITQWLGFHWLFWLPMTATVVAAITATVLIPGSGERMPARVNLFTAALMAGWLLCVLLALSQAPVRGWSSRPVLLLLAAAATLAPAWVSLEKRSAMPLIDIAMLRTPAVWTSNAVALLVGISQFAIFGFLPQFVQTAPAAGYGFGADLTESGLILLPVTVSMFLSGVVTGPLAARYGARLVAVVGSGIAVVPLVSMAVVHDHIWQVCLAGAVLGLSFGSAFAAVAGVVVHAVPAEQTGAASGMNANIRTIGGCIGAALMATIVTSGTGSGVPHEAGYTYGFIALAGAAALSVAAAAAIPRRYAFTAEPVPARG